jgi:hypothetical protein
LSLTSCHALPAQASNSDEYQLYQATKASLDFMVAEEQARNTAKGFWVQLLGALRRGELPDSFGAACQPPTREERQRFWNVQQAQQPAAGAEQQADSKPAPTRDTAWCCGLRSRKAAAQPAAAAQVDVEAGTTEGKLKGGWAATAGK